MLAGVILAGGKSSRMGTDKSALVIPESQQSLLQLGRQTLALLCDNSIFVSGEQHPQGIPDIIPDCGPLSGIHAAITHIQSKDSAITEVLVTAVDMPDLSIQDLIHLLKMGRENQRLCCYTNCFLPVYIPLSPALNHYLNTSLTQQNNKTAKQAKPRQYAIKTMFDVLQGRQIPPLKHTQLDNINTPEQWQQRCAKQTFTKATK